MEITMCCLVAEDLEWCLAFQKIKSDITNNISEVDKQKRNFLSDISDIRKSVNDHLDQIEKQTVEEMVSVEQKNAASMYLRSLSMCTMAVDDLAFSVTSRMGRNSWQWKIEKQTVEEMVSVEQNLQVELKKVLFAMETKRTDFDNILQVFLWNLCLKCNFFYKTGTTMLCCNRYNTKARNIFH
jgi:hypothetical protein